MKFKRNGNIYEDVGEKYFICEFDEKWCVYRNKENGMCEFKCKFNTLEEAKEFVKRDFCKTY